MTLGGQYAALVWLSLFILSSTHHKSAVHQIMKMEYNAIKIQGAIKRTEVGRGGLRGFGLLSRTQQWNPTGPGLYHSPQSETTVLEHPL